MKIPFVSFLPMERELESELREAFARVFERSWYIDGKKMKLLKKLLQNIVGQSTVLVVAMDQML